MELTDEEKSWLIEIVEHFEKEDLSTRDRQIRVWKKLKLLWDGFQKTWYSEVAHDWRIYDEQSNEDNQQEAYNKPVNVFRAYLETIIAALSIVIPPVKCYPDDADNPLDILTAKAGDKIGELISKHNDVSLLWLHSLFILCTEGMIACHNYTHEDESYGTYEEDIEEETEEAHKLTSCSMCGAPIDETLADDEFDPSDESIAQEQVDKMMCPECQAQMIPDTQKQKMKVTRIVGTTTKPKSRQCMEMYGGLYVKIPIYAKCQKDIPYLIFSYETNYVIVRERYRALKDKIKGGMGGNDENSRWGRISPQYYGETPVDTVTCKNTWLRPCAFEVLDDERCDALKVKFPRGVKIVMVDQEFAEAITESLDDHWTLTQNPLSDYLYFDPLGLLLTPIQEITNDLISLVLQTIEHGIPQTFADPDVLDFKIYNQMEVLPGAIWPARPKTGKNISESFYEVKTASLSAEVLPFSNQVQELGQLVSGALPSIFGGQISGSGTASEYSMSRAQAQQRLQVMWKMLIIWWKTIYGKVIPAYINTIREDERIVQKDDFGGFINVLVRKAELEGKIGSFEIEANENLPMTWNQRRDVIMKLLETNNQQLLAMVAQPENLALIYEAIGINDFYVPGEDDRIKQYDEIKQLVNSEPIEQPPSEEDMAIAIQTGQPPQPLELPSVEIDPIIDNHAVEFEICRKWANSPAGQLAKIENQAGYKNVLLHAVLHKQMLMQEQMMAQQAQQGAAPLASPKQNKQAPITEDTNA